MYKNRHSDVKRSIKGKLHRLKICQVFNLSMNNDAIRDNGWTAGTPDSVHRDPWSSMNSEIQAGRDSRSITVTENTKFHSCLFMTCWMCPSKLIWLPAAIHMYDKVIQRQEEKSPERSHPGPKCDKHLFLVPGLFHNLQFRRLATATLVKYILFYSSGVT